jgi:NADH dehydrogenase/NADH:ubiquinone oxidoreductase subunit G
MIKPLYKHNTFSYLNINHQAYIIEPQELDITLIQFLDKKNILLPRFCYHESLSVAGNCRMCLVEVVGSIKPLIACATPLLEGMEVLTNSSLVKKARESVLEFLLINHPLDCPICDQAGECDLQDQTLLFGSDRGRFEEQKRGVSDKNFGYFIKTVMTRCIHRTRCVRFMEEIAQKPLIGMFGRGKQSEISIYTNKGIEHNLSGNLIDVCPVGALTSKPYAFTARPWELINVESIDILDSLNSNIIISIKNNNIMRILPKINPEINGFWISNVIRFIYDSIKINRLTTPMLKSIDTNTFISCSWNIVNKLLLNIIFKSNIHFILGKNIDLETLFLIQTFSDIMNSKISSEISINSYYKPKINFFSKLNDIILSNLYIINNFSLHDNMPVLWSFLNKKNNVIQIGTFIDKSISHLGINSITLQLLLSGRSFFGKYIYNYNKTYLINNDNNIINNKLINELNFNDNTDNILYDYLGIISEKKKISYNLLYLINTINNNFIQEDYNFIIYQGTHYVLDSFKANLLLPIASFVEDSLLYINIQGYFQRTNKAINTINSIRTNILIFSMILKKYNLNISFISYYNLLLGPLNNLDIIINKPLTSNYYIYNKLFIMDKKELHNIFCLSSKYIMTEFQFRNKKNDFFY